MSRHSPKAKNTADKNRETHDRETRDRKSHGGDHHPQSPLYTPRELDPLAHPKEVEGSIERERARPKDTGRGGA